MPAKPSNDQQASKLRVNKDGRPFAKDLSELFASFASQVPLSPRRQFLRNYAFTFTPEEAISELSHLKYTRLKRNTDGDQSDNSSSTITTTFNMTKDMARNICQYFMDACYIECPTDTSSRHFKEKSFYTISRKGARILERFATKNGISITHMNDFFANVQPTTVYQIQRTRENDDLEFTNQALFSAFRRMLGSVPNDITIRIDDVSNAISDRSSDSSSTKLPETSLGLEVKDRQHFYKLYRHTFTGPQAPAWLLEHTTIINQHEAHQLCDAFVAKGWINEVLDPNEKPKKDAKYHSGKAALYHVTIEGKKIADWTSDLSLFGIGDDIDDSRSNTSDWDSYVTPRSAGNRSSVADDSDVRKLLPKSSGKDNGAPHLRFAETGSVASRTANGARPGSLLERFHQLNFNAPPNNDAVEVLTDPKETKTNKLKKILDDPQFRTLFKDFLRQNFCEENIEFYIDHTSLRRKLRSLSPALSSRAQLDLLADALHIYNTYLAPSSKYELNVDHALRQQIVSYVQSNISSGKDKSHHSLLALIKMFDKCNDQICKLMANDSVPKFLRTDVYLELLALRTQAEEANGVSSDGLPLIVQ